MADIEGIFLFYLLSSDNREGRAASMSWRESLYELLG
jgi:hypothetical protein